MELCKWIAIGKPSKIKIDEREYEYEIGKYSDNNTKTIRFTGIVTYTEHQKLKEKLSKKYKWYK